MKRAPASRDTSWLPSVAGAIVVVAALYFARVVFIPLALAILLSLLLNPPVTFLEKIKFPRTLAIFLVLVVLFGLLGLAGWKASQQFIDLTTQLPLYKKTLQDKIHSLKGPGSQTLNKASDTVRDLEKEIATSVPGSSPADDEKKTRAPLGASPAHPLAVEVVPPTNPLESVENMLGPLATVGIVIVFTVFILVGREDLRDRLIRLAGRGRLTVITQAMDDATRRVNRYLFLQLLVNSAYGLIIGIGLHFIGIPNAALWGVSSAILRFLPYVGPPLAALMPILLSAAVFSGWNHALETAGLFLVLELVAANIVEPLLYGAHIGLSPLAILVAAVFWTLIWGFPGLVLSTPLTVCLVVMGRYVPSLSFLNVLLGDQQALPPHAQYYQRLLAADQDEARQILEQSLKDKSPEELYSSVVIPALRLAEEDRHRNELDPEAQTFIYQSTREIIEELDDLSAEHPAEPITDKPPAPVQREPAHRLEVVCIPARDEADDVVAMLLARLLERQGYSALSIPIASTAEMLSQVAHLEPAVVCLSALPPFAIDHARALYAKLRTQSPALQVIVCLWHFEGDPQKTTARLKLATGHAFFSTMPQVLQHIAFLAQAKAVREP